MVSQSLWKVVCCRDFCYSIGWQPCHYERQFVVEIFLLQWIVALSLWKVVCYRYLCYSNGWWSCYRDFCYSNGWYPSHYGRQSVVEILVTPVDGSLDIMEGSLLSRFLDGSLDIMEGSLLWIFGLLQWLYPCHYGRQSIVEIFVTPMDDRLVIMEGSPLSRFL